MSDAITMSAAMQRALLCLDETSWRQPPAFCRQVGATDFGQELYAKPRKKGMGRPGGVMLERLVAAGLALCFRDRHGVKYEISGHGHKFATGLRAGRAAARPA